MNTSAQAYCHNFARKQLTEATRKQIEQEQRLKRARLLREREEKRLALAAAKRDFSQAIRLQEQELSGSLEERRAADEQILQQKRLRIEAVNVGRQMLQMQEEALQRQRRERYEQAKEAEMHRWWKIEDQSVQELRKKEECVARVQEDEMRTRQATQEAAIDRKAQILKKREQEAKTCNARATARSHLYRKQLEEETQLMLEIERLRSHINQFDEQGPLLASNAVGSSVGDADCSNHEEETSAVNERMLNGGMPSLQRDELDDHE